MQVRRLLAGWLAGWLADLGGWLAELGWSELALICSNYIHPARPAPMVHPWLTLPWAGGFCSHKPAGLTWPEPGLPPWAHCPPSWPPAVVSASLDGTVRAYDLVRYRNFRTLTTPTPVQFVSLAVDPAGEVGPTAGLAAFAFGTWLVVLPCSW